MIESGDCGKAKRFKYSKRESVGEQQCLDRGPYHQNNDIIFGLMTSCSIVDEYTRKCLVITVSGRIRSSDVIEQLARLISLHGAPRHLRSDNGTEFVSHAVLKWLRGHRIDTAFSDPGKPWQNGLDESFNDKFRDECLNMEWFRTRAEACVVIETWRKEYNEIRPHSSLNYQTPNEYISTLPKTASQQTIL